VAFAHKSHEGTFQQWDPAMRKQETRVQSVRFQKHTTIHQTGSRQMIELQEMD